MRRHVWATGVAVVALGLSACSGGGDDEPKATPSTDATSASPTPEPAPTGADGVTYEIANWADYSDDPVVATYKTVNESIAASMNQRKVLKDFREGTGKKRLRTLVANMKIVEKNDWELPTTAKAKVRDVETSGDTAVLTMCVWRPTVIFYDRDGRVIGSPDRYWDREVTTMTRSRDRWVITSVDRPGKCKGGAPA